MTPRVTASTPPAEWPIFMTLREVAIVAGRSYRYLANRCSAGLMWPPPVSDEHGTLRPLRFKKELVQQALDGTLPRPRRLALVTARGRRRSA